MPTCVEVFVDVATRCGVEIVTGVPLEFEQSGAPNEGWDGQLNYFPLGADKELAAFENCLGHSVLLIDRRRFETIGGFESGVDAAIEDWLLLARAVLAGGALEIAPSPLYWLRAARSRPFEVDQKVENQRRILRAYDGENSATLARALESVIVWSPQTRASVVAALAGIGGVAKDRAMELSFTYTPTDPNSFKPFVEYCIARGRFREATEFAALISPATLLPIVQNAADAVAIQAAMVESTAASSNRLQWIELTGPVAKKIGFVSGQNDSLLSREHEIVTAYHVPSGLSILKAAATCPPGARSVEAVVAVEGPGVSDLRFALAVCEPEAVMKMPGGQLLAQEGAWWSGWTRAAERGAPTSVKATLDRSVNQPLDVFLLTRIEGDISARPRLIWRAVNAQILAPDPIARGAITPDARSASLPRHFLDRAELLTAAPDFPVPFFTAGEPTMHHPLAGRAAIVRLRNAIFPGAAGVRALVSVQNERAHPIEFALWARRSSEPAADESSLMGSLGSSGWSKVRVPFRQHEVALDLRSSAGEPLDLYLATRVSEFPDVDWCHAAWHDICVWESPVSAR
jgi:hypothetical protein